MARDQFTFYRSFWESVRTLKKKEDRISILEAICAYALDGEQRPMTNTAEGIFILIRPVLDAAEKKAKAGTSRSKTQSNAEQNGNTSGTEREQNEIKTGTERDQTRNRTRSNEEQNDIITITLADQNGNEGEGEIEKEKEKEKEVEVEKEKEDECPPKEITRKAGAKVRPISEQNGNRTGTPDSSGLEKKAFGEYVRLDLVEYGELLRELGFSRYIAAKDAVDKAENAGCQDWQTLIRRAAQEKGA